MLIGIGRLQHNGFTSPSGVEENATCCHSSHDVTFPQRTPALDTDRGHLGVSHGCRGFLAAYLTIDRCWLPDANEPMQGSGEMSDGEW